MNMTDEQMRIAIAEACGWNSIREQDYDHGHSGDDVRQMWVGLSPDSNEFEQLPDYLNDLNAMHEAEIAKGMHYDQKWCETVVNIALQEAGLGFLDTDGWDWVLLVSRLSARQRAEAFLRTLNFEPK